MSPVDIGIGLGSNIGDKAGQIRAAVAALKASGAVTAVVMSSLYRTAPWGHVTDQDWFVNACAVGRTTMSPEDLLVRFKTIEQQLGRTTTVRWGPRVIDIDLLFYGAVALDTPDLTLPHKELLRRAFVLVPLAEIAPDRLIGDVRVRDAAAAISVGDIELQTPAHPRDGGDPEDQAGGGSEPTS